MNIILFTLYYVKLRLSVVVGAHRTKNPLDVNWRWKHWQYRQTLKGGKLF